MRCRLLDSRITEGKTKIAEQKVRVEESQKSLKVVEESKAGKEAYDKVEATLFELRQKEHQRRNIEQEIAGLEKEAQRFSQKLEHERGEIDKTGKQLDVEQEKINSDRTGLQPDAQLAAVAARVTELRKEIEVQRGQRALLDGRRESLLEGKEKLAEGICPVFQEECRNIAGSAPRDVFSTRISELERQSFDLDEKLKQLALQLKDAEAAEKELNSRSIRLQELDKQVAGSGGAPQQKPGACGRTGYDSKAAG